jgi:hypothetical protein
VVATKKTRTVLCLGPPHCGKSVFCYLLFKFFRELGNNACVMDGDYYSPTYRRLRIVDFADPDEYDHIIATPNAQKLKKLTEENFCRMARGIHESIEHTGIIVLDGVGKYSSSTQCLLELAEIIIVLCPKSFKTKTDSQRCGYTKDGQKIHPFDFYGSRRNKCIKITTHYHDDVIAYFDEKKSEGELYDLDKEVIKKGKIDGIPQETKDTVLQICKFILGKWI